MAEEDVDKLAHTQVREKKKGSPGVKVVSFGDTKTTCKDLGSFVMFPFGCQQIYGTTAT